jgi:replication factor C subunit 3/5
MDCITNKEEMSNTTIPWIEKYRPKKIKNILYNDFIVKSLDNFLKHKQLPNLLFYGPPGTGKTSTIVTIAKKYYGEHFDLMTITVNASEERGIETVRNHIKDFSSTKGFIDRSEIPPFKLVILDEIDAMTPEAQAILRKVVEEYTFNVRFCFICNIINKIDPAIISRCTYFKFKPFTYEYLNDFIENICKKENFKMSKKSTSLVIKKSNGDLRKLLNVLQSIKMYIINKNITSTVKEDVISEILSCPLKKTVSDLLDFIQSNDLKNSMNYFTDTISSNVISLAEFIDSIFMIIKDRIINNDITVIKYSIVKSANIIKYLSHINNNLNNCNSENTQIRSFIACFYLD